MSTIQGLAVSVLGARQITQANYRSGKHTTVNLTPIPLQYHHWQGNIANRLALSGSTYKHNKKLYAVLRRNCAFNLIRFIYYALSHGLVDAFPCRPATKDCSHTGSVVNERTESTAGNTTYRITPNISSRTYIEDWD